MIRDQEIIEILTGKMVVSFDTPKFSFDIFWIISMRERFKYRALLSLRESSQKNQPDRGVRRHIVLRKCVCVSIGVHLVNLLD